MPFPPINRLANPQRAANQHGARRQQFIQRVERVRPRLKQLLAQPAPADDNGLPLRARALLLTAEGLDDKTTAQRTGLSANAVRRAKLRFELYGLPGLHTPAPLPTTRVT